MFASAPLRSINPLAPETKDVANKCFSFRDIYVENSTISFQSVKISLVLISSSMLVSEKGHRMIIILIFEACKLQDIMLIKCIFVYYCIIYLNIEYSFVIYITYKISSAQVNATMCSWLTSTTLGRLWSSGALLTILIRSRWIIFIFSLVGTLM